MRSRRYFAAAVAAVALAGSWGAAVPAGAQEVVSDEELDGMRGGFLVADGVVFDFGATIRTYEDGVLSLQTNVTWALDGIHIEQLVGAGVTPVTSADLSALTGLGDVFRTAGGATVLHDVDQGRLLSVLLNTTSDHSFRQDTALTLVLPGFDATQADMVRQLAGVRISNDMNTASIGALGH